MALFAMDALAKAPGSQADDLLYQYVDSDSRPIAIAAARSLAARGDDAPVSSMIDTLTEELAHLDGGVRTRAAQSLGRTGAEAAVEPLTLAMADNNSEVRVRAAQALGRTRSELAIPQLIAALNDPIAEVRSAAQRSLDRLRNQNQAIPVQF